MEDILRIVYDKSLTNKILNLDDIEIVLDRLIITKQLNEYISNMKIQQIGSNNLASYSNYTKIITIYSNVIDLMIQNIDKQLLFADDFSKTLYKNLSIIQVVMHEVEHANQEKMLDYDNSLESYILKLSELIEDSPDLYEIKPEERFAEINSYKEILSLLNILNKKSLKINELIETDNLQRLLRGYHYKNQKIESPLVTYFEKGHKPELLIPLGLNNDNEKVISAFDLNDRFKYGFPILIDEYATSMNRLVINTKRNFKNRVLINKNL